MKKILCLLMAILMMAALAACGDASEPVEETSAAGGAGVYTFTEPVLGGNSEMVYTIELKEDGTYSITQENPAMEAVVYTGSAWEWKDTFFTTGAVESETKPAISWFNYDTTCMWLVEGEGAARPMSYVDGMSSGSDSALLTNIPYADDSAAQVLNVYLPEGVDGPAPVIVVVHGGGFRFGNQTMGVIQPIFAATEQGYAVVSIDYRKSGEAVFPAALADTKAAVRWVRANADTYGFDGENIAIWGESAGAYLSLMTALTPEVTELNGDVDQNLDQSSAVKALVSFYAPVEFWVMDAEAEELGMSASFSGDSSFESAFLGQAVGADEEFTYTTWWGTYIDQLPENYALSAWIQVGDSDTRVPYTQSVNFAEKLPEVIGEENVQFGIIEGANHEDAAFYTAENLAQVYAFLDGVLK